jgi:hypothetical protein
MNMERARLMKVVFCYALPTIVQGFGANETLHFRTTTFWAQLLYLGSMWPSVVIHEHWPVSQRMIVEMGDYAWSEHIVRLPCYLTGVATVPPRMA